VIKILLNINSSIFNFKRSDWPQKHNFCHFLNFIVHAFRFLIVCQSIDQKSLFQFYDEQSGEDETCLHMINLIQRRYEKFKDMIPQNATVLDCLRQDD